MRLPDINNVTYDNSKLIKYLKLKKIEPIKMEINIMSDKDKVKAIKTAERMIRSSLEYKAYIKYLKKYIDMTKCSFFNNVNNKDGKKVSIEIHHEPFTLFDITQAVLEKQLDETGEVNLFNISEEVMKLHYQCKVGLLPLSATVHELVHLGEVFIPLQSPRGDYIGFLEEYDRYITMDMKDMLQEKLKLSRQVQDLSLLETKYTYVEVDGFKFPSLVSQEKISSSIEKINEYQSTQEPNMWDSLNESNEQVKF